jgi:hypothetical protein
MSCLRRARVRGLARRRGRTPPGGFRNFIEPPACDVVDVPIDRYVLRHQWVSPDALDVIDHTLILGPYCQPFNKLGRVRARPPSICQNQ